MAGDPNCLGLGLPTKLPARVREAWFLEDVTVDALLSQKTQGFKALYCLYLGIENHYGLGAEYIHNFIYIYVFTHTCKRTHILTLSAIEIRNF